MGIDKKLVGFEKDTEQRDAFIALWIPWGLLGLSIETTSAPLQILGILRLSKKEERNLHNQDFISEPA